MDLGSVPSGVVASGTAMKSTRAGSDVAVVYIAGRTDFIEALENSVLQHVRMAGVYRCEGQPRDNFLKALEAATDAFPDAPWYFLADDDSFVHLERLSDVVEKFDATEYQMMGGYDYPPETIEDAEYPNVQCVSGMMSSDGPGWVCGGPGILLSAPLAHAMSALKCSDTYGGTGYWNPEGYNGGDVEVGCCAWDAWPEISMTNLNDTFIFHSAMPGEVPDMGMDLVSVHHLDPDATRQLGETHNAHLMKY
eukprot:CAMPEP_0194543936 /NCGR_PEP_ID=MMETSP0253-20130528/86683_1 /TAXON_ID=2966 /ORGANISM="Noctiluca scintillans" /LENGTH=249 /DNA_ID=CAMNT_0039390751 /DNA_START=140 /DNA_END=889 /DNA_ORIENTATION=+